MHLSDQQPEIYARFQKFIKNKARKARALYILGDLFEYYLGDDAISGVIKLVRDDINELEKNHATKCYFMPGNRDFLLSSKFADLQVLQDPTCIKLDNNNIILTHGDILCTDDKEYQLIRKTLRSSQWQQGFLSKNLKERIQFAKEARDKSQKHTKISSSEIMDVNSRAMKKMFNQFNVPLMIHGHTHRPAFHSYKQNNKQLQRMVLGDWHYQTSYIEYKNNHFQLITC